jgi:hypothetical protein
MFSDMEGATESANISAAVLVGLWVLADGLMSHCLRGRECAP